RRRTRVGIKRESSLEHANSVLLLVLKREALGDAKAHLVEVDRPLTKRRQNALNTGPLTQRVVELGGILLAPVLQNAPALHLSREGIAPFAPWRREFRDLGV